MNPHQHLKRLGKIWIEQPVYFVTTCVAGRRALLANETVHAILREEWKGLWSRHDWAVGRYVIMPAHVHFFLMASRTSSRPLSIVVGKWKEWKAKRVLRGLGERPPLWQAEFFDHVLRSDESKSEKWIYVRENPVRAALVAKAEDWPYSGSVDFE
jgi:putative transposase